MHGRIRAVKDAVDQLDSADEQHVLLMLTTQYQWMKELQGELGGMQLNGDVCNEEYRRVVLEKVQEIMPAIKSILDVVGSRTQGNLSGASATVDTGEKFISKRMHTESQTEPNFKQRFRNANPTILLSMLIALILNVFSHVTRPWCNTVLGLLNLLLETTSRESNSPTIPCDIRTVRKKFDLDPVTRIFASCTRCSCTYAPATTKNKPYPERCTYQKYRGGKPCGQLLVKRTKGDGRKLWAPVRPYVVQDFNSFLGSILSRPGMEEAMDRGTQFNEKYQMWDIKDGTIMQEIPGPDEKPFMDGLKRTDLRLAWSLSVDWFNPHGNKTSGKKKSVGSVAMGLLNLPPSLRYKAENIYLAGIIPGPREPALDEINHFLRPVVDFFLPSWTDGTWFTRTVKYPGGRLSRSVIAVAINDLPAARKLAGRAGPTANQMCGLCWLMKSDIANFDYKTWRRRTCQEHRAAAEEWKNAETKSDRDKIFKQHGVRWSELLRLPYWDPMRFIVIDGMHNLFLGVVQHHFREVIVIDKQGSKEFRKADKRPVDAKEMDNGRKIMKSNPTTSSLARLRLPVLANLVEESGVVLSNQGRNTKAKLIAALLVGCSLLPSQSNN